MLSDQIDRFCVRRVLGLAVRGIIGSSVVVAANVFFAGGTSSGIEKPALSVSIQLNLRQCYVGEVSFMSS